VLNARPCVHSLSAVKRGFGWRCRGRLVRRPRTGGERDQQQNRACAHRWFPLPPKYRKRGRL